MHQIKTFIAMRILYPFFKLFPLNRKLIFFEASQGRYTSNPKYIFLELQDDPNFKSFKLVWAMNDTTIKLERANIVPIYSIKYLYYLAVSGTLINDNMWHPQMKKRSNQIFIQTWHGTPLKMIAKDTNVPNNDSKIVQKNELYSSKNAKLFDLLISSSSYTTQKFRSAFDYNGHILECGSPRVDYLLKNKDIKLNEYSDFDKVVLVAPSFRKSLRGDDQFEYFINGFKIKELAAHFPNYCFLLKLHNYAFSKNHGEYKNIVDVSGLDDINDLYLKSDILLTDYSSVMFDFSVLNKPIIQFPFDYDFVNKVITIDNEPLYLELPNEILPCKTATNYDSLIDCFLSDFTDVSKTLSEFEHGTSSKTILTWLYNQR